MKQIKVLLADDHSIMRVGLSSLLSREKDMTVVGEAENGEEAVEKARELKPDCIAAPEARGFLFAAPVALELGCRLALIRKPKKLPRASISETYALEYGTDTIAIHEDAIPAGSRVLILDDLLATGGTVVACRKLVERLGSTVVGYGFLIELSSECDGRKVLEADGTAKVFSIIDY